MLVLLVGFMPSPALAHNSLVDSNPKNGASLASAPLEWTLTFKNDVPLSSASGEVIDSSGVRIALPSPRHGADQKQVVFSLPQNLTGSITARWKLVNTDGHVVTERVTFTVGIAATSTPGAGATTTSVGSAPVVSSPVMTTESSGPSSTSESIRFLLRLAGYVAVLVYGGLVVNLLLTGSTMWSMVHVQRAAIVSSAVLALAPLLQLLVFLDDTHETGVLGSFTKIFDSFDTTAGSMLLVRFVIGVAILAAVAGRLNLVSPAVHSLSGLYVFSLAYVGHSRSMAWPVLGVPVDVVHTASVAVWLGGLSVFALLVAPGLSAEQVLEGFRRFGRVAQWAVVLIVVTGVIQTLRLHTTLVTLLTESHGRWLALKLVVVAMMLRVGDINRRRMLRNLPEESDVVSSHVAMVRRASLTEVALGGVVMLLTTVLVTSSFG